MTNQCNVANNFGIAEGAPQYFLGMEAKPVPLKKTLLPLYLQPHYVNGAFANVYLLALDNSKR